MRVSLPVILLLFGLSVLANPIEGATSRKKTTTSASGKSSQSSAQKKAGQKKASSKGKATPEKQTPKEPVKEEVTPAEKPQEPSDLPPELPAPVNPEEYLKKSKEFQSGLRAMSDHLPAVAIRHFNDILAASPPAAIIPYVYCQLAEAYIRNNQFDEGLAALAKSPEARMLSGSVFWEAVACKGRGYYTRALGLFQSLENSPELSVPEKSSLYWQMAEIYFLLNNLEQSQLVLQQLLNDKSPNIQQAARLALAVLEIQLKRPEKAIEYIQELLNSSSNESPYVLGYAKLVQAKALFSQGKAREAQALMEKLIAEPQTPPRIVDMAKLAAAEAEIILEKQGKLRSEEEKGRGEDRLLSFIEAEPDSPLLAQVFNILRENKAFKDPEAYKKLQGWAKGTQSQRTPFAMATLAREAISRDEVVTLEELFQRAGKDFPDHPAALDLQYLVIQYLFDHKKWEQAEKLSAQLPESTARTLFMKAGLAFGKEQYEEAAALYAQALALVHESYSNATQYVVFNEALSVIEAQMPDVLSGVLSNPRVTPETQSDILLEKALEAASRLDESAIKLLKEFIEQYPKHHRLADACLALGELALYQESPLVGDTLFAISTLESLSLNEDQKERLARLRILLPEYMEQWPAAIQAARNYLDVYKTPHLRDPMQLKLGELLYRDGDYNQAHLYLQNIISRLPKESPLRIPALFLSAKAAQQTNTQSSLNKALILFEEVAAQDSSYQASAEIEVASILLRQGKSEEVIKRLDQFIKNENLNEESRRLALALGAEAWASLSSTHPEALDKARSMTAVILESPDLPPAWRSRTLFQQARLAEMAGDSESALRDYHLITSINPDSFHRREWYWYYQAGFAAMHLLEEMKNWEGAIALAEYMAKSGGPRAEEAAKRARKIRLEHFVWGDDIFSDSEATDLLPKGLNPDADKEKKFSSDEPDERDAATDGKKLPPVDSAPIAQDQLM